MQEHGRATINSDGIYPLTFVGRLTENIQVIPQTQNIMEEEKDTFSAPLK